MNELIEAQRLEQNTLQRTSATDTTDSVEPRFVEVMDTDTENQLNDEIQREIVNVLPKKTKQKKAKKATTASKKIKNSKRTTVVESMDLSSDSSAGDPDFDPDQTE